MPPPITVTELFQTYVHGVFVNTPRYCDNMLAAYDTATEQERYGIAWAVREHARIIAQNLTTAASIPAVRARAENEYRVANFDLPTTGQTIVQQANAIVTQYDANISSMNASKWTQFRQAVLNLRNAADVTPT